MSLLGRLLLLPRPPLRHRALAPFRHLPLPHRQHPLPIAPTRLLALSTKPRPSSARPARRPTRPGGGPSSALTRAALDERAHAPAARGRKRGGQSRRVGRKAPPRAFVLPDLGLTVRQLAALARVPEDGVLRAAKELDGAVGDSGDVLAPALVELVTEELNLNLKFRPQTVALTAEMEGGTKRMSKKAVKGVAKGVAEERMRLRMPVVTVMGHVDHGKTSLLDALRQSDVAGGEHGGITQSVAAFQVPINTSGGSSRDERDGSASQFATFIDTPGHAAFKAMRTNGTVGTDIVVLVVAADDGVMPQSIEAATLARAANVPIIVAVNKCDAPGADPERIRYQLVEKLSLNTEQLGGDVQCVDISAKMGTNLTQLLEAISLQAEMLDLQSDPTARAAGICLESRVDRSLGSIATVVVRSGTLRPGDLVLMQASKVLHGDLFGRVRTLLASDGRQLKEAGPGVAAGIVGVKMPIPPGAQFVVEPNEKSARLKSQDMIARNIEAIGTIEVANAAWAEKEAKDTAKSESQRKSEKSDAPAAADASEEKDSAGGDKKIRSIVVLVKGDVKGSADAVAQCVQAMSTKQYPIRILEAGVGDVTDMDVKIASSSHKVKGNTDEAMIVAFNVRVKDSDLRNARKAKVTILSHKLIYHLEDELRERIGRIHDEETVVEDSLGKAGVVQIFEDGKIAGCSVNEGSITKGDAAHVWRYPSVSSGKTEREIVFSGSVESIKQLRKAVNVISRGNECGISLAGWEAFAAGDVIECVRSRRLGDSVHK